MDHSCPVIYDAAVAIYERVILFVAGSLVLAGFAAASAFVVYGVLWLFPDLRSSYVAGVFLLTICLAVLIPGVLVGGGLMVIACSSKKSLR